MCIFVYLDCTYPSRQFIVSLEFPRGNFQERSDFPDYFVLPSTRYNGWHAEEYGDEKLFVIMNNKVQM